jgi:hypothetical protein
MTRTRDYRGDETIDTRDLEQRLEELEAALEEEKETWEEGDNDDPYLEEMFDDWDELKAIRDLKDEVSDWIDGQTLIRDDYFVTYAEEFAEDIGAISSDAQWPLRHIDWEAAAEELQTDYTEVEFDGTSYWYRA